VAFNADPNDIGAVPLWQDLTAFVRKVSQWTRGRQYELAQSLAAQPRITWRDPNEYLNPANTSSPYYPNVQPYRQLLGQAMWPNDGTGNLINTGRWRPNNEVASDPSFESYANGAAMPNWLTAVGGVTGSITTTNPQQGTKSLTYAVAGTASRQGVSWEADCVPGQQYTTSAYMRQSTGSTQGLLVDDQVLAYDNFGRTASNGWGTADFGGNWSTANGSASDFSVSSGVGKHSIGTLNVRRFTYMGSTFVDSNNVITISCPTLITTSSSSDYVFAGIHARYIDVDNHYRCEIGFARDGYIGLIGMTKRVAGVSTDISGTLAFPIGHLPYASGQQYKLRFEVTGNTVRCKLWPATGTEPTAWTLSNTDTALSAAGAVGAHTAASTGVTNTLPVVVNFDSMMCSGSTATSTVTTSGSYVRFTSTFTASQPKHTITVCTFGTATAGTVNIDAIQHEPGATANAFTTSGPVIYPIMRPYIERWPRGWLSAGFEGIAVTPAVDSFAALNTTAIWPDYYYAVFATRPALFYPLKSGTSESFFADYSGNEGTTLGPLVGPFGAGTSPSYGSALPLAGDAGALGVGFVPDQSVSLPNFSFQAATVVGAGRANGINDFIFPGFLASTVAAGLTLSLWGATISCWFKATTKSPNNYSYMIALIDQSTYQEIFSIGLDGNGSPWGYSQGTAGTSNFAFFSTPSYLDNKLHFLSATLEQVNGGNTTIEVFIDGVSLGSNVVSTAAMGGIYTRDASLISIGALANGLQMYAVTNGTVEHVHMWTRKLTSTEISTLYTAGATGNNNELTGTRLTRHFASAPFVGATRFSAGLTTLEPPTWQGSIDLLSDGQQITVAEDGTFWAAPDGATVFEGRMDRWQRTSARYVLGENTAGGEVPYLDGIVFDDDPTFVFANVQVSRTNGGTFRGGTSADIATATRKFFGRSAPAETSDYATDAQAQDKADWVFNTHRAPGQRVSVVVIDPSSNPTIWPTALSLEVGQRITVKRRAKAANAGAGITMSGDYFVEAVTNYEIDMDKGEWKYGLLLSPIGLAPDVSVQPWILEDTTYGVLDSTTMLGW
jgi:hypothetical protein